MTLTADTILDRAFQPPPRAHERLDFVYTPRWYQRDLFAAMNPREASRAKLHGCCVWPRREGKDLTGINFMTTKALQRRGSYYYFFPTYRLGKRIIWDGMDNEGRPYRHYIPGEIVEAENETELQITLQNGSIIYILGADNVDLTARGTNVVGVIYSEYRDMSPTVQQTIDPILEANGGWELIITTPRGHNHLYDLVQSITTDPVLKKHWYYSHHTVDTLYQHDPMAYAAKLERLDLLRRRGVPEEWIQQEYYCSFEGFQEGSFFSEGLARAYREDRVTALPTVDNALVHTASDLGSKNLSFATWYWQEVNDWLHLIDFSEQPAGGIPEFKRELARKGYQYGCHYAPFDIGTTEIGTGLTRLEHASDIGIDFLALPKIRAVGDRINAGRLQFPRIRFDEKRCQVGLSHLLNYRREYDETAEVYKEKEVHDKHSHGGSAFTYLAMAAGEIGQALRRGQTAEMDFDEFAYDKRAGAMAEDGYGSAAAY